MRASPDLCAERSRVGAAPTKVAQEELKKELEIRDDPTRPVHFYIDSIQHFMDLSRFKGFAPSFSNRLSVLKSSKNG
ncbi:hypothetical protein P343_05780 [Sporolactobacillus laevolacticus DSM 442]|uniref:Uncharacterized protein n=1 Tax=Sporolactobacillus laevolacticus DSM 442 TaxID=1395513 RepID=V6IZ09_9BACL|nr:hypothetical protein P343_05780 [Sporolactobacillus laevolacticus DSM 442]